MVFSVQQGEHGPLVVYKLTVPEASDSVLEEPVASSRPSSPLVPLDAVINRASRQIVPVAVPSQETAAPRLSSLEPTILGTVVMPASRRLTPQPPAAGESSGGVKLAVPSYEEVNRIVSDAPAYEAMINEGTGDYLTLDEVNKAVVWRRDTVEKLRQVPITPRF